jgi:hypothetical protein
VDQSRVDSAVADQKLKLSDEKNIEREQKRNKSISFSGGIRTRALKTEQILFFTATAEVTKEIEDYKDTVRAM